MDITPQITNLSVGMENVILEERETENKTDNFGHFLIGRIMINWKIKCYRQGEITHTFI